METKLGQGVYTLGEAARLTGLRLRRVREWFQNRSGGDNRQPGFTGDYQPIAGDYARSFHDLIDVFVAGQLREHGATLRTIRCVHERLRADLHTPHPFCRRELLSDGPLIFLRGLDEQGQEELSEVLTRQQVFPDILLPFLKTLDYDKVTSLAQRWRIAEQVVVDPALGFGKPLVEAVGIPTAVLAAAYAANDRDAELVADWFGVHPLHVRAAVAFEKNLAA